LLLVLPSLLVFAAFAVGGLQILRRTTNRANDLIVSMLVAPVALIVFGFLRGLDPGGFLLVYRAFDFLDYALAVLIGVAFVAAWRGIGRSRAARAGLGVAFLAALLLTTPMAWNTPAVFGVQNVTTSDEFQALAVLGSLGARIRTFRRNCGTMRASSAPTTPSCWSGGPRSVRRSIRLRTSSSFRKPWPHSSRPIASCTRPAFRETGSSSCKSYPEHPIDSIGPRTIWLATHLLRLWERIGSSS